jgi:hypothetical protein
MYKALSTELVPRRCNLVFRQWTLRLCQSKKYGMIIKILCPYFPQEYLLIRDSEILGKFVKVTSESEWGSFYRPIKSSREPSHLLTRRAWKIEASCRHIFIHSNLLPSLEVLPHCFYLSFLPWDQNRLELYTQIHINWKIFLFSLNLWSATLSLARVCAALLIGDAALG